VYVDMCIDPCPYVCVYMYMYVERAVFVLNEYLCVYTYT